MIIDNWSTFCDINFARVGVIIFSDKENNLSLVVWVAGTARNFFAAKDNSGNLAVLHFHQLIMSIFLALKPSAKYIQWLLLIFGHHAIQNCCGLRLLIIVSLD